jgi:hypothetical protein
MHYLPFTSHRAPGERNNELIREALIKQKPEHLTKNRKAGMSHFPPLKCLLPFAFAFAFAFAFCFLQLQLQLGFCSLQETPMGTTNDGETKQRQRNRRGREEGRGRIRAPQGL